MICAVISLGWNRARASALANLDDALPEGDDNREENPPVALPFVAEAEVDMDGPPAVKSPGSKPLPPPFPTPDTPPLAATADAIIDNPLVPLEDPLTRRCSEAEADAEALVLIVLVFSCAVSIVLLTGVLAPMKWEKAQCFIRGSISDLTTTNLNDVIIMIETLWERIPQILTNRIVSMGAFNRTTYRSRHHS